jgi:endonuclease/exonuclease/phosphatase family metal-dependent hydrolase
MKSHLIHLVAAAFVFICGCATPQRRAEPTVAETAALRNPSRAGTNRVRIASFNIQNFGKTKVNNPAVLSQILAIVQAFDVVAIQEVSDKSGEAMNKFRAALGPDFELIVSERTGRATDDRTSQEQYAFVIRRNTIQLEGTPEVYADGEDAFQREPYLARFKCVNGNFTFVLINIHTQPERAVAEIGALDSVVRWARTRFVGEEDFILLGDFNGSCTYAKPAELDALAIRGADYVWIIPDGADTNLAQAACAYDRIVLTQSAVEDYASKWDVYRVFSEKKISDHWPVWAEFFADRDTR